MCIRDSNTYIRGGISYKHQLGKWKFEEALDLVAAAGFSTTSCIVQQAYVDIRYKWFGFFAGSREQNAPLRNQELSSGGMTWSGNARPIPQVQIGIPEYVQLLPLSLIHIYSSLAGQQPARTHFARQQYLHTWRNILQTPTWKMEV